MFPSVPSGPCLAQADLAVSGVARPSAWPAATATANTLGSVVLDVRTRAVIVRGITHAVRPVTLQPTWRGGLDHRPDKPTPIGTNVTRPHLQAGSRSARADPHTSATVSVLAELRYA